LKSLNRWIGSGAAAPASARSNQRAARLPVKQRDQQVHIEERASDLFLLAQTLKGLLGDDPALGRYIERA
jgi:hypothetical protein